ncbi:Hint domain-containing protein [Lentibacter algarum]|uniref:Hint domain-containing protein n=1 Tax=Lentibacter algarum TaxID=576131 RepID=UPI001C07E4CD|nr:Hint domain-containing protein [Lentibacter algarum]MBU2982070.1 Hint domain-containing protein [Lentibacter algarum]
MPDTLLGGIVINEILVDPNGVNNFDTDGNGTASNTDEFVEFYNTSGSAIDISGLEIWDQGVGNWFTFPPGTVLQPGAHAVVIVGVQAGGSLPTGGANDLFFDAGRGTAVINNGGDNLTLYDPASDTFIQATFNGDSLDDPTTYTGFSSTAVRNGSGEDFGNDVDGSSLVRSPDGGNTFTTGTPTPGTSNVCFVTGTRLLTDAGETPVENISIGDMVWTLDSGFQPVLWAFCARRTRQEISASPNLAPVRIAAGALGAARPRRDLLVSQQHRVLVKGPVARRLFDCNEVLVPAKRLLEIEGVNLDPMGEDIGYHHIMLDRHQVLLSEGLATESLYLGDQAVKALSPEAVEELEAILQQPIQKICNKMRGEGAARPLAKGKLAKQLVAQHCADRRPIGAGRQAA